MRNQQSKITFQTTHERSIRMKQKRKIRKLKLIERGYLAQKQDDPSYAKREEKMTGQKIKNRQAAQKSRQQKKKHISQLQRQIKYLRQIIKKNRICENCQKQLQIKEQSATNFQSPSTNSQDNSTDILTSPSANSNQISSNEINQSFGLEEDSQFIQINSSNQSSSIGMYLFICMIVLGVFCIVPRSGTSEGPNPRDLTQFFSGSIDEEFFTQNTKQQIYQYDTNLSSTFSTTLSSFQENQGKLVSTTQLTHSSMMPLEYYVGEIIKQYEDYKENNFTERNLRSTLSQIEQDKSLLFCSGSKIYQSSDEQSGILTTFIDIFIYGAEMISLFPGFPDQLSYVSTGIQTSGLYKITASVEKITEIPFQNIKSVYQ